MESRNQPLTSCFPYKKSHVTQFHRIQLFAMSISQTQPKFLYGLKHFFSLPLRGNILASQGLCENV
ncbi:hypothetical protein LguiA_011741 [Lonicera macranthoides]